MRKLAYTIFINTLLSISMSVLTTVANAASTEQAYLDDFPVILSASRLEQSLLDTPSSITVIDRSLIEASGAQHIPELFRFVPGMQLGHATDNIPVAVYHGLGDRHSRRIQVLIDGRSIYTPAFGGVSWENIPITVDDIEKIEIIRGPNSALYGSNAFSAVISITSRFGAGTVRSGIHTVVENSENNSIKANWQSSHGQWDYALSTFYYTDQGDQSNTTKSEADDDRRRAINLSINFQISDLDNLHLDTGALDAAGRIGNENDSTDIERDTKRDYNYVRIKHDHQFESGDSYYFQFSHTQESFEADTFPLAVQVADNQPVILSANFSNNFSSNRTDLDFAYTPNLTGNFRYVTGFSLRQDKVISSSNLLNDEEISVSRAFFNSELHLSSSALLGLGGMFEHHGYSGDSFSPKLSLIQKLNDSYALRFIASKATRAPIAFEQNGYFNNIIDFDPTALSATLGALGTTLSASSIPSQIKALNIKGTNDLQNEEQTSFEIGLRANLNKNLKSQFDIRLFYDELDNLINEYDRQKIIGSNLYSLQESTLLGVLADLENNLALGNSINKLGREFRRFLEVELYKNFISLKKYGVEFELTQQLNEAITLSAGATYLKIKNNNSDSEKQAFYNLSLSNADIDNRLRETPETAPVKSGFISLLLSPSEYTSINLAYHYTDNSTWLSDGEPNLGIQRIVNFYAQLEHPLGRKQTLKTGIGIRNLTNDNYIDFNPRNPSETTSYFKLGLDF